MNFETILNIVQGTKHTLDVGMKSGQLFERVLVLKTFPSLGIAVMKGSEEPNVPRLYVDVSQIEFINLRDGERVVE